MNVTLFVIMSIMTWSWDMKSKRILTGTANGCEDEVGGGGAYAILPASASGPG